MTSFLAEKIELRFAFVFDCFHLLLHLLFSCKISLTVTRFEMLVPATYVHLNPIL